MTMPLFRGFAPRIFLSLGLCASFVTGAGAVMVDTPASFSGQIAATAGANVKESDQSKPGSYSVSAHNKIGSSTATLVFTAKPDAGISVAGSTQGAGKLQANGAGTIVYYFQVMGPRSVAVPVIATASGAISGISKATSAASVVQVTTNLGFTRFPVSASCPYAYPKDGLIKYVVHCGSYDTPVTVKTKASTKSIAALPNEILMLADQVVRGVGASAASNSITLQIDPSFAEASKYRIVVSTPIGAP